MPGATDRDESLVDGRLKEGGANAAGRCSPGAVNAGMDVAGALASRKCKDDVGGLEAPRTGGASSRGGGALGAGDLGVASNALAVLVARGGLARGRCASRRTCLGESKLSSTTRIGLAERV